MSRGEEQARAYLEHLKTHEHERKELEHEVLEEIVKDAENKGYHFEPEDLLKLKKEPKELLALTWHL